MKMQLTRLARPLVERYPTLAKTYRYVRDSWRLNDKPRETPLGFKFVGDASMLQGQYEPVETSLVTRILPHVDIVVNVGANIGYYCCLALRENKYVIAFEPVNLNVQYLCRNIKANNWESGIEVYPIALGDRKSGVVELYGGAAGASLVKGWENTSESNVALVPCSTLDHVLGGKLQGNRCLVIVDIEGAELAMLEGAVTMLSNRPQPVWMVEISVAEHQPRGTRVNPNLTQTFQLFWDHGYEAWTADQHCRFIDHAEIRQIAETGIDTVNARNFLFIERGQKGEYLKD